MYGKGAIHQRTEMTSSKRKREREKGKASTLH
jgi:hypothetical protein